MTTNARATAAGTEGAAFEPGKATVERLVKAGADAASRSYETFMALARERVEAGLKAASRAASGYDEVSVFGRANLEAVVASGTTVANGMETVLKGWLALGQKSIEGGVAAAKGAMACRNLKDFVDWQAAVSRNQVDVMLDEATRLSEVGAKTAQEALLPLTERFNATVDRMLRQPAAS